MIINTKTVTEITDDKQVLHRSGVKPGNKIYITPKLPERGEFFDAGEIWGESGLCYITRRLYEFSSILPSNLTLYSDNAEVLIMLHSSAIL